MSFMYSKFYCFERKTVIKEKVVNLMKEKLNITKAVSDYKKLTISDKDNLWSAYKKLAAYLTANHEFTEEEYKEIVRSTIAQSFDASKITSIKKTDKSILARSDLATISVKSKKIARAKDKRWEQHIYEINVDNLYFNKKRKTKISVIKVIVDPDFIFKPDTYHHFFYRLSDGKELGGSYDILMFANLTYDYGYQEIKDQFSKFLNPVLWNQFKSTSLFDNLFDERYGKDRFSQRYLNTEEIVKRAVNLNPVNFSDFEEDNTFLPETRYYSIRSRINARYIDSTDEYIVEYLITEEALKNTYDISTPEEMKNNCRMLIYKRRYNDALYSCLFMKKLNEFLRQTKSVIVQFQYEIDQTKALHAKFYQEKKNINKQTLQVMDDLKDQLSKRVSAVEIDNEVDLDRLNDIKVELNQTLDLLPTAANSAKPILRFRKLRNHKALGIYAFVNNTIAVDFRSSDHGSEEKGKGGFNIGLQSLIHEYGHFLDYNNAPSDQITLSLTEGFSLILASATAMLSKLKVKKYGYLSTPTEVFARAFELYVSDCGLDNDFISDPENYNSGRLDRYLCFKNVRQDIIIYFDKLFPSLRGNIQKYNQLVKAGQTSASIPTNVSDKKVDSNKSVEKAENDKTSDSSISKPVIDITVNKEEQVYQTTLF